MAQDFRNVLKSATGTGPVSVLVAGDYDAVIGIRLCNIVATSITVDVYITNTATNYYLAKGVNIPPNSAIELIQGGAKIVMNNTDVLKAQASASNSCAVYVSYIDAISS